MELSDFVDSGKMPVTSFAVYQSPLVFTVVNSYYPKLDLAPLAKSS
jgi:hypothetical protein